MKKLTIAISIYFLFTTSLLAASVYDGIWEIKNLHITEMKPPASPIPGRSFQLDAISPGDFFGPIENFSLISKFGNSGIILIAQKGGYIVPGLFSMRNKELNAEIPLFFGGTPDIAKGHTVRIIFNDTKTATYKRTYWLGMPLPDPITGKPSPSLGHPTFTVEGTLHKVVEPFD